jgi:hypothetical protein
MLRRRLFQEALMQTFLGSPGKVDFEWNFIDLGLTYRSKESLGNQNHILCRPAQTALLELFRSLPLPEDFKRRINLGNLSGDDFETALFH